jgi:predicted GNAT family N-acyltransferase
MSVHKTYKITNLENIIRWAVITVNLRKNEKIKKMTELPIQLKRKNLLPIVRVLDPEKEVPAVNRIIRDVDLQALEKGADEILVLGKIAGNRASREEDNSYSISLSKLLETAGIPVPESMEIRNQEKLRDFFKALGYPLPFTIIWLKEPDGNLSLNEILSTLDFINSYYLYADDDTRAKFDKSFSFATEDWKKIFPYYDEISKLAMAGLILKKDPDFYKKSILPWLKGD